MSTKNAAKRYLSSPAASPPRNRPRASSVVEMDSEQRKVAQTDFETMMQEMQKTMKELDLQEVYEVNLVQKVLNDLLEAIEVANAATSEDAGANVKSVSFSKVKQEIFKDRFGLVVDSPSPFNETGSLDTFLTSILQDLNKAGPQSGQSRLGTLDVAFKTIDSNANFHTFVMRLNFIVEFLNMS
ncbi:hypothetical protein H0H81_003594, partial [Sphagnurus paluster]